MDNVFGAVVLLLCVTIVIIAGFLTIRSPSKKQQISPPPVVEPQHTVEVRNFSSGRDIDVDIDSTTDELHKAGHTCMAGCVGVNKCGFAGAVDRVLGYGVCSEDRQCGQGCE